MAEYIYICPRCKTVYRKRKNERVYCTNCGAETVFSGYTDEEWYAGTDEEERAELKEIVIRGEHPEIENGKKKDNRINGLDVRQLPDGMTKKELISQPEMRTIRGWFIWAGIVEIVSGVLGLAQYGAWVQQNGSGGLEITVLLDVVFIILGILLIATKYAGLAIAVGGIGILWAIICIALGGSVGGGIIATVLAIVGAVKFNKVWDAYLIQERRNRRNAQRMVSRQKNPIGVLTITRINRPKGVRIFLPSQGMEEPVFIKGEYSFYPTCAIGVGYYLGIDELATDPFAVELTQDDIEEPSDEWVQYFIREIRRKNASSELDRLPIQERIAE